MAELSAQRVRSKMRSAVRRREDEIEQDEIESGELNLIPYLDIVTNLVLFLLATVVAQLFFVQIDTMLPDKAPPSTQIQQPQTPNPDDQPLKMFVTVTRDRVIIWSVTGLEGTLQQPKATFPRVGHDGDPCDGAYMCESNLCSEQLRCLPSKEQIQPVFDYRAINDVLFEIANRRYNGRPRKNDTYQGVLQADPSTPYATIVALLSAMRCKLPEFGKEPAGCALPTEDKALKADPNPISPDGKLYDTSRAIYDPKKMALFSDILFSSGFE